jgi:hypothetical protein
MATDSSSDSKTDASRRAAASAKPRSQTPANGSELPKQSLKIGVLLVVARMTD